MDKTMQQTQPQIQERTVETTPIQGLYVITMKQITEGRGTIREAYRKSSYTDVGINENTFWAQVNVTETRKGGIRGIHAEDMNKLVAVVTGEGFGAYVDLRRDSPTKGAVFTVKLTKGVQVFVPKGVGNGFQSVSTEPSQYLYCFDQEWIPGMAGSAVNPFDPELAIAWPVAVDAVDTSLVSQKDASAPSLKVVLES